MRRLSDPQVPGTEKRPEKEVKIWDLKPWRGGELRGSEER